MPVSAVGGDERRRRRGRPRDREPVGAVVADGTLVEARPGLGPEAQGEQREQTESERRSDDREDDVHAAKIRRTTAPLKPPVRLGAAARAAR
jgi:hypothetical protein